MSVLIMLYKDSESESDKEVIKTVISYLTYRGQ